ncbi:MAG: AAA family ATPase [Saprospiraceae bacterium]
MIPYGISDYKELKEKGYYYIDKTRFIGLIERQPPYLFLIRPRRFGKSLLVSMLEAYYDSAGKDHFQDYFGATDIGSAPTSSANSYLTLKFDFSGISPEQALSHFNAYCNAVLHTFVDKYQLPIELKHDSALSNLSTLFIRGQLEKLQIYVLVDEYDNFVNELLVKDEQQYLAMVTGTEAVYKQFFKTLKAGTSGVDAPVKKIFVTGVSPLAMFDLTSGFNIGTNITTDAAFNDLLGVTEQEATEMMEHFHLTGKKDLIFDRIRFWYNGYRFNKNIGHSIFNTDMILYYFNSLVQDGQEPEDLIDVNVRSDYSKIRFLIQTDRKLNGNFSVLNGLLATGKVDAISIKNSFSAFEIRDRDNFVSLLFYLGLISIEKYENLAYQLRIPNQTIRKILGEFLQKSLEENVGLDIRLNVFSEHLRQFASQGKPDVFHYLGAELDRNSKIRDYISGESFVKGFLTAYLSLNPFYEVSTEEERTKGFVDIYLQPITKEVTYGAAIELKYIKRNELTGAVLEAKISEGKAQLDKYSTPPNILKILLVFHGWELVYVERTGGHLEDRSHS